MDILMVKRDGRLSGEAFVVLSSPMHVEVALSKNRTYLGRRYIEVYRAKKVVSCGGGVRSKFVVASRSPARVRACREGLSWNGVSVVMP